MCFVFVFGCDCFVLVKARLSFDGAKVRHNFCSHNRFLRMRGNKHPVSFHRDVNQFSFASFAESLHECFECGAAVIDVAWADGAAYEDAALRVLGVVAGVDADALAARHIHQQRQPSLELGRPRDEDGIASGADGAG